MLEDRFGQGMTFAEFLEVAVENRELWPKLYERAALPEAFAARVRALPGRWHLLVLSEDWCGDSVNTIPMLQRLTEAAPGVDLRLLGRDANLDLMDAHLTGTSRSIPVVMVLDEDFRERGWWGPRPAPLQKWVLEEGLKLPKEERYKLVRTWYVRDRGATMLEEVVSLLERIAAGAQAPPLPAAAAEPVR
ncbi:MAG TPA: thioredoxin family protein [Longimicrobiaceae bacterium]|jgi:hypothetical protein|nr:thioredoxin family protein [Longimicrobiaceae bacterium]